MKKFKFLKNIMINKRGKTIFTQSFHTIGDAIKIIITFLILTSIGCEKVIDDPNFSNKQPLITVNSILTVDSTFKVALTKSLSILDNDTIIYINKAVVKVYEDNKFLDSLIFDEKSDCYVSTSATVKAGKTYKIEASANNFPSATVEEYIPMPVEVSKIETFKRKERKYDDYDTQSNDSIYKNIIKVYIQDPADEENYYILSTYIKNNLINYNTDKLYENLNQLTPLAFETKSIFLEYIANDNLFDFTQVSSDEGLNADYAYTGSQAAFTDAAFNGKEINIELKYPYYDYNNYYYTNDTTQTDTTNEMIYVFLYSVSKNYYNYISSYAKYLESKDNFFTEKVKIFTNIKDGYGIVIGKSASIKIATIKNFK